MESKLKKMFWSRVFKFRKYFLIKFLNLALYNYVLTEEQKQRKIKCVTWDDKVVEVNFEFIFCLKLRVFE